MKNWYHRNITRIWKANLTVHDGEFEYNQDIYIEGAKTEEEAMSEARYQASIWFNDEEPAEPYCEADDSWEERSGYRIISLQGVRRIEGWQELLSSVYPVKFMKRNGTNVKKEYEMMLSTTPGLFNVREKLPEAPVLHTGKLVDCESWIKEQQK